MLLAIHLAVLLFAAEPTKADRIGHNEMPLVVKVVEDKKESGQDWTRLIAVIGLALTAVGLVVNSVMSMRLAKYNAERAVEKEATVKRATLLNDQLAQFYCPLYALFQTNSGIFQKFGPKSFPDDEAKASVAEEVWRELREAVVLKNNDKILEIVRDRTHLLAEGDAIENYSELITHISLYRFFVNKPTQLQLSNRFPERVVTHVRSVIEKVSAQLKQLGFKA